MAERRRVPLRVTLALLSGFSLGASAACTHDHNAPVGSYSSVDSTTPAQREARALVEQTGLANANYVIKDRLQIQYNGFMTLSQSPDQSPAEMQADLICKTVNTAKLIIYDWRVIFRVPNGTNESKKKEEAEVGRLKKGDFLAETLEEGIQDQQDPHALDQIIVFSIDSPDSPFAHYKQDAWEAGEQFGDSPSASYFDTEVRTMYRGKSPLTTAQYFATDIYNALVVATTTSKCAPISSSFFD